MPPLAAPAERRQAGLPWQASMQCGLGSCPLTGVEGGLGGGHAVRDANLWGQATDPCLPVNDAMRPMRWLPARLWQCCPQRGTALCPSALPCWRPDTHLDTQAAPQQVGALRLPHLAALVPLQHCRRKSGSHSQSVDTCHERRPLCAADLRNRRLFSQCHKQAAPRRPPPRTRLWPGKAQQLLLQRAAPLQRVLQVAEGQGQLAGLRLLALVAPGGKGRRRVKTKVGGVGRCLHLGMSLCSSQGHHSQRHSQDTAPRRFTGPAHLYWRSSWRMSLVALDTAML